MQYERLNWASRLKVNGVEYERFHFEGDKVLGCRAGVSTGRYGEDNREQVAITTEELIARLSQKHIEDVWEIDPGYGAGIPARFIDKSFSDFQADSQQAALDACQKFIQEDIECEGIGDSLVLSGPCGLGKTHLLVGMMKAFMRRMQVVSWDKREYRFRYRDCPARFITEIDLFDKIRASYADDSKGSESDVINEILNYELPFFDDVGKVSFAKPDFCQRIWYMIINQRYSEGRGIVMSTNLDLAGLKKHLGAASADRLLEMADFVVMTGNTYRLKAREQEKKKARP